MKKNYELPRIELLAIGVKDVLAASNDPLSSNAFDNGFNLGDVLGGGN